MKNTFFVGLAVVGLLAFAGCETAQPGATGSQQENTQAGPVLTETDETAYNAARQLDDVSYCDKISIEEVKVGCRTEVTDKMSEDKAMQMNDPTLCDKLSTDDKKGACKLELEAAAKINEKNAEPTKEEFDIYAKALEDKNLQLCEQIKNEDLKISCRINIEKQQ